MHTFLPHTKRPKRVFLLLGFASFTPSVMASGARGGDGALNPQLRPNPQSHFYLFYRWGGFLHCSSTGT